MSYVTTSSNPTGNRLALLESCGNTSLGDAGLLKPVLIAEEWSVGISWILGSPDKAQCLVFEINDSVQSVDFRPGTSNETIPGAFAATRPPIAVVETPFLPLPVPDSASLFQSAVPVPNGGLLFVNNNAQQSLLYRRTSDDNDQVMDEIVDSTIIDPLPDGAIVYSSVNQLWALYSRATNQRYVHAVLGDDMEGYHMNILKLENDTFVQTAHIELSGDSMVFEGLSPMFTDVDGDGIEDLLTTVATEGSGAALRVYFLNSDGTVKGEPVQSDFIGRGNRWLHQLASGPIDAAGGFEIVEIRTPHIGGIVRYYKFDSDSRKLRLTAEISGFTSHAIASRNLDQALMHDMNNDGVPELIVQSQDKKFLHGLQRTLTGVVSVWSVPLDAPIQSNIASICGTSNVPELVFATQRSSLVRVSFVRSSAHTSGASRLSSVFSGDSCFCPLVIIYLLLMGRRFF